VADVERAAVGCGALRVTGPCLYPRGGFAGFGLGYGQHPRGIPTPAVNTSTTPRDLLSGTYRTRTLARAEPPKATAVALAKNVTS
jgi:hypothetical protein